MAVKIYYQVLVNYPHSDGILTYYSDEESQYLRGQILIVPLRKKKVLAVVWKVFQQASDLEKECSFPLNKVRGIEGPLLPIFVFSEQQLIFWSWISRYYHYPLGQLFSDIFPGRIDSTFPKKVKYLKKALNKDFPFALTTLQHEVFSSLKNICEQNNPQVALLHGVTGSGKTIVFLKLIKSILAEGKSALVLVPEINLTPQYFKYFEQHLDGELIVYHGLLSIKEKYSIWSFLNNLQKAVVVIGTRSSIFLPINNLGLIVVDEEHDHSFKQENLCPYNARDLAIVKGHLTKNLHILLSSATPTLESLFLSNKNENTHYFSLSERVPGSYLPQVEVLQTSYKDFYWPMQKKALNLIDSALEKKEQVIVFVNRLGHSSYLECSHCGYSFICPNCTVALRFYKQKNELVCSCCNYSQNFQSLCPECACLEIVHYGYGTEKIKNFLCEYFPNSKIERFDRNELKNTKNATAVLDRFHKGEIDILVGTQMLSKGHNFQKVNTVIILGVDSLLNFPDYRNEERVFQMVTQVAGRSGRFSNEGKVIILSNNAESELWPYILNNQNGEFYQREMERREAFQLPPFTKTAIVYFSSKDLDLLQKAILKVKEEIRFLNTNEFHLGVDITNPRPCLVEKRKNYHYWNVFFKSASSIDLHKLLNYFLKKIELDKKIKITVDVDPYQLH